MSLLFNLDKKISAGENVLVTFSASFDRCFSRKFENSLGSAIQICCVTLFGL